MKKTSFLGFSLLEITFVVAILTTILLSVIPYWQSFIVNYRMKERVDSLQSAINFSRNLALKERLPLVVRPIVDKEWSKGLCLFVDDDGTHQLTERKKLLRSWQWDDRLLSVSWHGFRSDHYLKFSDDLLKSSLSGRFVVSANSNNIKKSVIINRLGRSRVEDDSI